MSAVMTPRRARRARRMRPAPAPGGQSALFGAGAVPAPAAAGPAVDSPTAGSTTVETTTTAPAAASATTASAHRHGPTLDDLVAGAWEGLVAGAHADCLVCGAPLAPRYSAGAGIVGGRCDGCGTTVS